MDSTATVHGRLTNSQLPTAVSVKAFLAQFSVLEKNGVGLALRVLSKDEIFVQDAEQSLEFDARLVLLKRLILARSVPEDLSLALDLALAHARKLAGYRNHLVAENALVKHLHTTRQVNSYTREAEELTFNMAEIAKRLKDRR